MKHANVALFVPNNGCPHACSFCSQRSITDRESQPTQDDVQKAAEIALKSLGTEAKNAEIAFFGGSFTAIERSYMVSLLEAAAQYVWDGRFSGIRISTRPDYIDPEILSILKHYGVKTIELGAQSMDDRVLALNGRGHTAKQVEQASDLIRSGGFTLGLQMMTGLFGDNNEGARLTAQKIANLKPTCVRIYPTITLRGTELGELYRKGVYHPQTLDEAVDLCAELLDFFESRKIAVIRLGLHSSPGLERDMLAGPWHPAFRELCESRRYFIKITNELQDKRIPPRAIRIFVNPKCVSAVIGQKKQNLTKLSMLGYPTTIVPDSSVERESFKIL